MTPGRTVGRAPFGAVNLLLYGFFGLPLAMVALPIYVYLPQFYAERAGISLGAIGAALLAARIAAAFIDPALGWWVGRTAAGRAGGPRYRRYVWCSLAPLLAGFIGLFHPPALGAGATLAWFGATLMLVYLGFSLATIAHQSWGAALTQAPALRARVTGTREACGLLGVVLAAAVTAAAGYTALAIAFSLALLLGAALLSRAAPPAARSDAAATAPALAAGVEGMLAPFRQRRFRSLFAVLLVNGIASSIPATLFLFFATDRLRLGPLAGLFLIVYFVAAALSMPLWVALARRFGEARAWAGAMLASSVVFVWAYFLDAGAALGFGVICALSGLALGADLALPPALLAGVVKQAGQSGRGEAAYFGVWNWGVQITLALAAGIALPLLGWCGYVPGQQGGVIALAGAYALLPCVLKCVAAAMLWRAPLRDC
ncbi:MFS transporter [Massilia sp. PWRC2]|uniref:MFS transporter n=1 Tax=Massilia sp. PWRC2 TaxID=2804626 RepID=UPI003CFB5EB2